MKIECDIETLLNFNSEKMIEPHPSEKFSSKDEFYIEMSELAEIWKSDWFAQFLKNLVFEILTVNDWFGSFISYGWVFIIMPELLKK